MLISLAICGGQAHALGLGAITLQSGLGWPLQANIPIYGLSADDVGANCVKTRVMALEGGLLSRPLAEVTGSGAGAMLSIRTVENINEPVIDVSVEIGCAGPVKRQYQILLDPVPAALPMAAAAAPASAGRPERAKRKPPAEAGIDPAPVDPKPTRPARNLGSTPPGPTTAPVRRKPVAPAKPKPTAGTKSVLTLTAGDAEIEQARDRIAHPPRTAPSEPRLETDPAKLAALSANQAGVAAQPRDEDLIAGLQAQLREAQDKLLAAQKSAESAARQHQQEKAALAAAQENLVSGKLLALLGALLLACLAVIGRLLWRNADDRRRQEQAFIALTMEQEAPSTAPSQPKHAGQDDPAKTDLPALTPPATTVPDAMLEPGTTDITVPAGIAAPAPAPGYSHQTYDWHAEAVEPTVSSSPPESLAMPDSWLALENQSVDGGAQAPRAADLRQAMPAADDGTQVHAAELAGMLLAAESWMAEHNPRRAAEVLRPYLDRADTLSPAPGLYLLSLYRTMDDKGQVATVLAQLQQDFPAAAAAWSSQSQPNRSMADFPAVHAIVDSLSGTDMLLPYLYSLLLAPEPFDFFTYRDIVRAIGLANEMKQESDTRSMSLDFQ